MGQLALPTIPDSEKTPTVVLLLEYLRRLDAECRALRAENALLKADNQRLKEENQQLRDEINQLKKQKSKPKFSGSNPMERSRSSRGKGGFSKPQFLGKIREETITLHPEDLPEGAKLKDYTLFHAQEVDLAVRKITFRLARYELPDGTLIHARPPKEYRKGHFGPELVAYCLQLYHGGRMTQPRLLEHLQEMGFELSASELDHLLTRDLEEFAEENQEVFEAGMTSSYLNVDDTGAKHRGKNGYCLHIGNPHFAFFQTSFSKSRITFLKTLQGKRCLYPLIYDEEAYAYLMEFGLSDGALHALESGHRTRFRSEKQWGLYLNSLGITGKRDVRLATEGALIGSLIAYGFSLETVIMSDGAKQFAGLGHTLCWLHIERPLRKLIPVSTHERREIGQVQESIWSYYDRLKAYKECPTDRQTLESDFLKLCYMKVKSPRVQEVLMSLRNHRTELLLVLSKPWLPLHNNDSERDIREMVTRRKVSSGTRSERGKRARDVFTALRLTCRKQGISYWGYLKDRCQQLGEVEWLGDVVRKSIAAAG